MVVGGILTLAGVAIITLRTAQEGVNTRDLEPS
jgi:hypothetical protein